MKYELTKTDGKAVWTHEGEYRSERLTITREGTARLTHHNGGWGGAWDSRTFTPEEPKILTLEEAAATLESWGVVDDELSKIRALRPYSAADFSA
jgi:hypothetical protein